MQMTWLGKGRNVVPQPKMQTLQNKSWTIYFFVGDTIMLGFSSIVYESKLIQWIFKQIYNYQICFNIFQVLYD